MTCFILYDHPYCESIRYVFIGNICNFLTTSDILIIQFLSYHKCVPFLTTVFNDIVDSALNECDGSVFIIYL